MENYKTNKQTNNKNKNNEITIKITHQFIVELSVIILFI